MEKLNVNEVELNGVIYIRKDAVTEQAKELNGMPFVLIRSYASGVHFGYLKSETETLSGKEVELVNSRRVFYWSGAASLSQIAIDGVKNSENCKIAMVLPNIRIMNIIEIIPVSEKAKLNLEGVKIWKQ